LDRLEHLRVAFVSDTDPASKAGWSGIPFHAYQALKAHFPHLTYMTSPAMDLALRGLNKVARPLKLDVLREDLTSIVFARLLERQWRRFKPELVIGVAASHMLARVEVDVPIIHFSDATFRAMLDYYPGQFSRLRARTVRQGDASEARMIEKAAAVVLSSEWACKSAIEDYGADPAKVFCVPLGANLETDPVHEAPAGADICRLLWVGVDWRRKGGDIALAVTRDLRARGVNAELHAAGCVPPPEAEGPGLVAHGFLNKGDPEQADRLNGLYRSASFFLLPSRAEAFGIVFAEASAFGLPSVTLATGGVPSAVEDGVNGLLLEADASPSQIADRIGQCWADRQAYAALRDSARQKHLSVLNWTAWAGSVVRIARPLVARVSAAQPSLAQAETAELELA
jgi:glycosyltransferase involved in cell wall biosynthesis